MARTRNLGNLTDLLSANTTTGIVSVNTAPAQFDNSSALASTGFVQQTIGSLGGYTSVSASRALLVSDIGKGLWIGAASVVLTLPTPTSLGLPPGASVTVFATSNAGSVVAGSGVTLVGPSSTSGTLNMTVGTSATFVALTGTTWQTVNSTAGMGQMAEFGSSQILSGYQKLPSGLVIQWGSYSGGSFTGGGTPTTIAYTFPVAFPNNAYAIANSLTLGQGSQSTTLTLEGLTKTGVNIRYYSSVNATWALNYIAIGN